MQKLLLVLTMFSGLVCSAQPSLSLRAYKQAVAPGTVPVGINENSSPGAEVRKRIATRYYFYLSYSPKTTIQPQRVWIGKKAYTIEVEPVPKTPVEHINRNIPTHPVTTVLVPRTSQKVVRLKPGAATSATPLPASARTLIETSELVVSYTWKGKTYYKALNKITVLDPEMME
ncbi:MAG TPA: hypothetical protein VGE66_17650 [Chitinophagaceae bacterium]